MENTESKKFSNIILESINNIDASISIKNKIKNDILIRIKNNGDRLKYINAKISNQDWTDSNRNFYTEIKEQILISTPHYESILSTATTTDNLLSNASYTRREISILANNYNEQRGILVQKNDDNIKNVFTIIDLNKKTKYHDKIVDDIIYYYPLDTGRTLYPLNDTANVALKSILGDTKDAIYMFRKNNADDYTFLGKYYMEGLEQDDNGNLVFVLRKFIKTRNKEEIGESVLSFWVKEDEWIRKNKIINSEDKEIIIKARANQGYYRGLLLQRFGNRCILSDIQNPELLIASHIKPYSKCSKEEKIDKNNGLLLNALVDKLFDRGLISFDSKGEVLFSPQISEADSLRIKDHLKHTNLGSIYSESEKYLEYHHRKIFRKEIL